VTGLGKLREGNDLAARLLRAGSREEPKQAARRRAERALGLSTLAAGIALTSTSSATVAGAGVGSGGSFALPMFAKWLSLGIFVGASAIGGVTALRTALEPPRAPLEHSADRASGARLDNAESHALTAPRALGDAPGAPSASATNQQSGSGIQVADSRRAAATLGGRQSPAQVPEAGVHLPLAANDARALSREVELLERVRARLRAGKSSEALAELDAVSGDIQTLLMEADLLRVEALIAHGERARAEALAAELERRNPRGGQSFRLKRLLGDP
jgi:hypothetical protein